MRVFVLTILLFFSPSAFSQAFDKSITVGVTPLYSHRVLSNNIGESYADSIINARNEYEHPIFSYGFFASYTQQLKERFFIEGELRYQRTGFESNIRLTNLNPRQPNDPAIRSEIDFFDIFQFLSLNINGKYKIAQKDKFSSFVRVGLGGDYLLDYKITGDSFNYSPRDFLFSERKVVLSGNLGIGSNYSITKNSAITSSLIFHSSIININTNPIRARLFHLGLNLGYAFKL